MSLTKLWRGSSVMFEQSRAIYLPHSMDQRHSRCIRQKTTKAQLEYAVRGTARSAVQFRCIRAIIRANHFTIRHSKLRAYKAESGCTAYGVDLEPSHHQVRNLVVTILLLRTCNVSVAKIDRNPRNKSSETEDHRV